MSRVAGVMLSMPLETCASACASHGSTSELAAARSCGVGFEHPLAAIATTSSAFDLARARARQLGVGEAQDADALVRAESRADLLEMGAQPILDRAAAFAARVGGHHQRGDLLTLADLQADDRHFLDVRRMAVNLFELVDVDIVAAGIDDHVLGAADDVEPPVVVEAAEVAGVQPSVVQHLVGGGLVAIVTRHHVRPAREDLADRAVAAGRRV